MSEIDIILKQLGVDIAPSFPYLGEGIKIGIIVAESQTYIKGTLSLEGSDIITLPSLLPPKEDSHPTVVLSQTVGQEVTANGIIFRGIVPKATAYIAPVRVENGVYTAIERMAAEGVKVINYSAGTVKGDYSEFDRRIDELIKENDFLFVTVSGNQRSISSPGRAENALTVGNLATKDYPDIPLPSPWEVWCRSEDNCSGFNMSGVHKPDLAAPGAWVGYVESENVINYNNFGTSFASPWAAGVGAVIYEIIGSDKSYLTVKAIILMSADDLSVSSSGNPLIGRYIRLRSGYGLLNFERAIEIAEVCDIYEGILDREYTIRVEGEADIMLAFEKGADSVTITLDGMNYSSGEENTILIKKRSRESSPLSVSGIADRFSLVVSRIMP